MQLAEALLELDQLYDDDHSKLAVCITSYHGNYVHYYIVCINFQNQAMGISLPVTGAISKEGLFHVLIGFPWDHIETVDNEATRSDCWFVSTLTELVELNNKLVTRSQYDN